MTEGLKIPILKMPTLEEHRAISAAWLSRIGPCLYENWPQALKDLSFRTELVELTREDQEILIGIIDNQPDALANTTLPDKITEAIQTISHDGCFVKLSSRSPKDTFYPDVIRFRTGHEVLGAFSESERIIDDLIQYKYADTPCYLMLREFLPIPLHDEWRCFVRKGEIVGVTQYHYHEFFPQLTAGKAAAYEHILSFLVDRVLPHLHVDTIVVDVWLGDNPLLIELNPYGLSDPCLLSYQELDGIELPLFKILEAVPVGETA